MASGTCIRCSSGFAAVTPTTVSTMPLSSASSMEVCTVCRRESRLPAPMNRAARMLVPTDSPTNRFTSRLMSAALEPTAARELSPANLPTTTMSAALNNSCKTLEHISGRAKASIFGSSLPLHMSISYRLARTTDPPPSSIKSVRLSYHLFTKMQHLFCIS